MLELQSLFKSYRGKALIEAKSTRLLRLLHLASW